MAVLRLIELEERASSCIRFQFKMFYITLTVVKHRAVRQCAANSDSFYLCCRTDLQKGRERGEQCWVVMNCWGAGGLAAQQKDCFPISAFRLCLHWMLPTGCVRVMLGLGC